MYESGVGFISRKNSKGACWVQNSGLGDFVEVKCVNFDCFLLSEGGSSACQRDLTLIEAISFADDLRITKVIYNSR
jgi:hypothetical protein